ncbi:MAG: hypothetical protein ACRDTR_01390 [Rubrobacter sp.]
MKRLMVLVAMLALMMAVAAPAFAQTVAIDEGDDVEFNGVGQNIIGSIGDINTGNAAVANSTANANASASGDSAAAAEANSTAEISQDSGVTISQTNVVGNVFFFDYDPYYYHYWWY